MDILEEYFNAKHKLTPDKKAPNAGFFERAGDLGVDALKGAIGLPESFVGLADIATGGRAGKFLDESLGYRPAEAKETLSGLYSEERQQESRDISRAFDEEGFFSGLAQAAIDPAVAIGGIVESLPQMLAGGKIAGAASKVLPNVSRAVLAGGSEGLLAAGSAAESIRNENEDKLLTTQQQLLAMGSGVGTALFGYAGNKIGNKFGLEDIDLLQGAKKSAVKELAETGTEKVSKSVTRRMLEGILSEGVLEELPQSTQEAIMQNIATGKEWNEGLSEAAGMGLISGGIMGGSMGIKTQVTHKAVLAHKAAVKKIGDEAAAEEQRIIDESAAAVGDGTGAIAVTGDSETLNELDTQAKVVETQAAATQATDQVTSETDAELLRVVADKIVSGERTFTPEELQAQQNNPEALEATLDARRQETMAREDLTPDEKAASVALDADPTIFRKLFAMAKTAKGFTAELVRRFGKGAKKFADRLWGLYKNSKLSDESGNIVIKQGVGHAIKTDIETTGTMTDKTTQRLVSILTNAEMEIEDGAPTAERLKTLGEIWKALDDGEIKDDLTALGKEYKAALDATTAVVETPAAAPVVETPAAVAPVVAPEIVLDINDKQDALDIEKGKDFINHSGGAKGSDTYWGTSGEKFGVVSKHYHAKGEKTPSGNSPINKETLKKADHLLVQANVSLGRNFPARSEYVNNLLRRNAWQVYNGDAVFAVGELDTDTTVKGGTGWAVQMGIDAGKPVYVFDQKKGKWFGWNGVQFAEETPTALTPNFAGIGTREINSKGKAAIDALYEQTFNPIDQQVVEEVIKTPEELALEADEVADPTRSDQDVKELHAARAEQLKKEDRPGYEPEFKGTQVVPEGFVRTEEDEGFEGDAPFERRARKDLTEQELIDRDMAAEGVRTEYDRFGYVRDRAMLREKEAGNKVLTFEQMQKIDQKMASDNDKAIEGATKELNNNPEFTIEDDFLDSQTGEFGKSLAEIISDDLFLLGSEIYIEDAINFIKREEARLLGKEDDSGRTKPLKSLSELNGYPESLSELISHVESVRAAEDYEHRTDAEENWEKEEFLRSIRLFLDDKEVTRNSKAIDLLSKRPDSIIDFIESEVHYSWDYSTADLKRIAQAFEDEFNAGITTDFLSFVIDSVKNEEIQRVEPETEEYKEMSDAKLNKILQRHMSRVDVSTKPILKEFKRREGQRAKGAEQKKIQRQYDRFKESASDKAQINRGTWVAFYRSMAELAGRGIGFQKNKLNVDALVPMVSQKAGGAFAALDKDTQRKLVIEMLQNSFINDGVFQHKFYREDVVEGETTEYSSEAFDAQYQATQLGEIVDTDLVDKSELRPAKQRTLNIREGVTLFEVSYTTETGRKVNATVNADRLETIIDENDKVTFKQLEGTHDVAENWSWASDVEKILDIATNRNLMATAATMNKMSEEAYTDMINDLYDKVYVEKDIDPQAKRDIDRQLRLISALAAEQQYANNVISDPNYFEKVAKENPELGLNAAELYNEYLKAGGDAMIFNSRVNRQVNPKYSEAQKVMTSTPQTVEDAFQETTFMEKSDSEYEFLGNAHRRVGPQKENADSFDQAKTGKLKNPVAQKFYGLVAKAFGADLIIVSDDHFASRYVGKAADGRPKIVINMKGSNHFAGIFAHELFHHVVNKAASDQYAAFKANLKDMVNPESWEKAVAKEMKERNVSRSMAEEEVMAEMFRSVVTTQAFYDRLSETKPGRTLAGKLITRLVANIGKIPGVINRDKSGWWHKNDQLLNHADMQPMYDLVTSLVTNVRREAPTQHTEERFLGPTGEALVSEIEGYLKTPKNWITGAWKRVFPVGTKNHRDVMKNLQKLLEDFLQFIKDVKPNAVFADFLADPIQTAIMNKLVFEAGWEVKKARKQVTDKHKKTFEKMTSAELERVHDVFVRSPQDDAAELEAERAEVQKKIEMIDAKYGAISGVKIDQVPEKYMAVRKEMDSLFMRRDEIDNTIVNGINVGTKDAPNKLGIAKAKELGFDDDVIEAFQDYKKVSMEIYGRLKEVYPDLKFRETHYGQSIRWRRENAPQHDDEFDFVLDPTKSKLKGSEHFLEEKSTENTAKIRERGFKYDSINPGELLLEYIREAEKTIALKNALEKAGKTLDKEGKPILRIFENEYDAMKAGYGKSSDAALNVYESLDLDEGYKVIVEGQPYEDAGVVAVFSTEQDANEKADELDGATVVKIELGRIQKTAGYEVIHTESKQVIGTFTKAEDAYDQLMKLQKGGQKFEVKVVQGTAKNAQVAQLYLSKDMARMMNNYLAKDRIRSTKAGEALMNVKNHMTGLEFAFSVFHALTIGQELMASYGAWAVTKSRRGEKKFGMVRALAESKEIVMLAEAAIADPSLLENEAFNNKVDELLGSTGIDIMDIAKQYALVGGRLHQDASLRSSAFKLGESHYRTGELGFKIEDGKVIFTGKRGLKAPADTVKAMGQSIKAVFDSQMKENPDKKVQALAKSLQFGVFQTTSAWLMEEAIPEVKMAMWMREYTLRLETQKGDIESGAVLKEEIAHNVMKFIEDRFGEVNWQNQWMDPTAKTFLQFAFRSFTWFTGSWKALTKAGVDVGKLGWFTVQDVGAKDEDKVNYKLTEKGQWGFAALFTHISTVMLVKALYLAVLAGSGDDEVPTDEDTPLLTELLFPRIDFDDPRARVTIPSYISEGYKIMRHLGVIGDEAEYSKLISGRTSSIIGNSIEALYAGEDWRGVSIRDPEDNAAVQAFDTLSHIFISPPISFSSIAKTYKNKGISPTMGLSVLGITDAPAAAKRSGATNKAFDLSREEFKGTSTTEDEMDVRDDVRRAMYKYSQGDKTEINEMRRNGEISDRQFKNALSKVATINGRKNPLFVPELQRALKRLTIKSAVEVWSHMTAKEKKEHRAQIIKKYRNMMVRKDKSRKEKKEIREAMKEAGIFK